MALQRLSITLLLLITQIQTQDSPGPPEPPAHVAIDIGNADQGSTSTAPYIEGMVSIENPDGEVCVAFPNYVLECEDGIPQPVGEWPAGISSDSYTENQQVCDAFSPLENAGMLCSDQGERVIPVRTALSDSFEEHCRQKCKCKRRRQEFQRREGERLSSLSFTTPPSCSPRRLVLTGTLCTFLAAFGMLTWWGVNIFGSHGYNGQTCRTLKVDQDDMLFIKHRQPKKHHRPQWKTNPESKLNLAFVGGGLSHFGGLGGKVKRDGTSDAAFEVSWIA